MKVAARKGVKSNYATTYKELLLTVGIIAEQAGVLRFDIPGLGDRLEETRSESAGE